METTGHRSFDGLENILYIVNTSMKTKLKRMSREKRKSCLRSMLNTKRTIISQLKFEPIVLKLLFHRTFAAVRCVSIIKQ